MKGNEGTGDPGGPDAKSGRYSSGSGLCPSGEKRFFADVSCTWDISGIPGVTPLLVYHWELVVWSHAGTDHIKEHLQFRNTQRVFF